MTTASAEGAGASSLRRVIEHHRVIVCCGAGGVGKTTTAASIAVAAAQLGRKVLVLTIDPSKRLAEALGVSRNPKRPIPMPPERAAKVGIATPGRLDAWMLDPKLVSDDAVHRFAGSEERARPILENRIYRQATTMVAGLHEYTAMKALHRFIVEGEYDLVVLDTPPSRNALDFLDAPARLASFLEGPVFEMFLPSKGSFFGRAASRLVARVLSAAFGDELAMELTGFFALFSTLFASLNRDLSDVRARLKESDVAFVLVTTPSPVALAEAYFFHDKVVALELPFGGFILNRSRANLEGKSYPRATLLPDDAPLALRAGIEKLAVLAREELVEMQRDRALLANLAHRGGEGTFALALPELAEGASDVGTLAGIAALVTTETTRDDAAPQRGQSQWPRSLFPGA